MELNELFEKINEKIEIENQIAENYGEATDEQVDFITEVSAMTSQQIEQLCECRKRGIIGRDDVSFYKNTIKEF